jgi:hypothetical protein
MPIDYARDDQQRRILLTATGTVTHGEVIAAIDRQLTEGTWTYGVLYDVRGDPALPKMSEVLDFIDYVRQLVTQHGRRGPVAVVTDMPANDRRARMYTTLSDPSRVTMASFSDIDEASRWLNVQMAPGDTV